MLIDIVVRNHEVVAAKPFNANTAEQVCKKGNEMNVSEDTLIRLIRKYAKERNWSSAQVQKIVYDIRKGYLY